MVPMHHSPTFPMDTRYAPNGGGPVPVPITDQPIPSFNINNDMAPPGTEPPPPGFENEIIAPERSDKDKERKTGQPLPVEPIATKQSPDRQRLTPDIPKERHVEHRAAPAEREREVSRPASERGDRRRRSRSHETARVRDRDRYDREKREERERARDNDRHVDRDKRDTERGADRSRGRDHDARVGSVREKQRDDRKDRNDRPERSNDRAERNDRNADRNRSERKERDAPDRVERNDKNDRKERDDRRERYERGELNFTSDFYQEKNTYKST